MTLLPARRNIGWFIRFPGFSTEPGMSERRVRVARLARDDWTPPKGERQRRRRGGAGEGERGETRRSPPGPSFTDRERPRVSRVPTKALAGGCPTPSRAVTRRLLPAFARCSTASHPRQRASLPLPSWPPASSRYSPRTAATTNDDDDDGDGGRETEFCHRRASDSFLFFRFAIAVARIRPPAGEPRVPLLASSSCSPCVQHTRG